MLSTKVALDLGAAAIVTNAGVQATTVTGMSPDMQNIIGAVTVVLSIVAIVYAVGSTVERIRQKGSQTEKKVGSDQVRFEKFETFLVGFKDEVLERFTSLEKDLISRRAAVDKEVSHHSWQIDAIEKNMRQSDSRERKNLRKLEHLETRMSPWLKEFEPEGTRAVGVAFQRIDEEESTSDGRD